MMGLSFDLSKIEFPWALFAVVAVYLIWKGKRPREVAYGVLRSVLGYYLVAIGASVTPFSTMALSGLMQTAFGVRGGVLNTETFNAALLVNYGGVALAILFGAFAVNLLLVRCTPFKGIFLTAHHFLYIALITAAVLRLETSLGIPGVIAVGSLLAGIFGWLCVNVARRPTRMVTGSEDISMAHSNVGALLVGALVGRLFRGRADRTPPKSPTRQAQLSSIPGLACVTALVAYALAACFAGREAAEACLGSEVASGIVLHALLYGAQIALLLYGFRMMLATIIELFWELAGRLGGSVWRGLDASVLIGNDSEVWNRGFFMGCVGSACATALLLACGAPFVPFVSPTCAYFTGGIAGVGGNAFGGRRGSVAASLLVCFASVLLIGLAANVLGIGTDMGVMFGEAQYGLYGLLVKGFAALFNRF